MPDKVGIERFAELYGCTIHHAQRLVRAGNAPRHLKIGRKVWFNESDIIDWLNAHIVNPDNK